RDWSSDVCSSDLTVGKSEQIEEPQEAITIQDARATSSPVIGDMSDYSSFEITKSYDIPVPVYDENEDLEEIINRWKVDERYYFYCAFGIYPGQLRIN